MTALRLMCGSKLNLSGSGKHVGIKDTWFVSLKTPVYVGLEFSSSSWVCRLYVLTLFLCAVEFYWLLIRAGESVLADFHLTVQLSEWGYSVSSAASVMWFTCCSGPSRLTWVPPGVRKEPDWTESFLNPADSSGPEWVTRQYVNLVK